MGKTRAYNNICPVKCRSWWDLIDDEKSGRIQATKLWLHIGNAFVTYKFWQIPADKVTADMMGAYAAIITLGYGGMYWLKNKGANDAANSEMVVEQQNTISSSTAVSSNKSMD